jgi:hypothetical protein
VPRRQLERHGLEDGERASGGVEEDLDQQHARDALDAEAEVAGGAVEATVLLRTQGEGGAPAQVPASCVPRAGRAELATS